MDIESTHKRNARVHSSTFGTNVKDCITIILIIGLNGVQKLIIEPSIPLPQEADLSSTTVTSKEEFIAILG